MDQLPCVRLMFPYIHEYIQELAGQLRLVPNRQRRHSGACAAAEPHACVNRALAERRGMSSTSIDSTSLLQHERTPTVQLAGNFIMELVCQMQGANR